jgi:hypothetical protein
MVIGPRSDIQRVSHFILSNFSGLWLGGGNEQHSMVNVINTGRDSNVTCGLSHPYFGQVWGWSPTLGKSGIWSPLGLPNVQSSTARGKTPRIGVFLVSLERSWNVDIENGLAFAIRTSAAQVMGKRRAGSQTGSLTPDH